MIEMGDNVHSPKGRQFKHGKTIRDLDARFAQEDERARLRLGGVLPAMARWAGERVNTSDPSVHQEGVGTSSDEAHGIKESK